MVVINSRTAIIKAAVVKACKRAAAVPRTGTLIDVVSDEEWLSESPDTWKIEVGTLKGEQNDE